MSRILRHASVVALALTLSFCASAQADTARDQKALTIAWTFWTTYAPIQSSAVQLICSPQTVQIQWVDYYPAGGIAAASVDGCRNGNPYIRVNKNQASSRWVKFCRVITHEYGHLIGFIHTENTKNVMASPDGYWGEVPSAATTTRAEQLCRRLG
ncbi:MAG: M57 family metalloprotease [Actinomycetota bacterium]|nr:M57 family metalloprotease [Actinomycetota bacterium]